MISGTKVCFRMAEVTNLPMRSTMLHDHAGIIISECILPVLTRGARQATAFPRLILSKVSSHPSSRGPQGQHKSSCSWGEPCHLQTFSHPSQHHQWGISLL